MSTSRGDFVNSFYKVPFRREASPFCARAGSAKIDKLAARPREYLCCCYWLLVAICGLDLVSCNCVFTVLGRARPRRDECLSDAQIDNLIERAQVNQFGRGERVIEEGADGDSMFVLLRGAAQVSVSKNGSAVPVATLRSGDCFGEMSLLTGEKRSATVRAQDDCYVMEISKEVMGEVIRESPDCLRQLSEILARRKLETEGVIKGASLAGDRGQCGGRVAGRGSAVVPVLRTDKLAGRVARTREHENSTKRRTVCFFCTQYNLVRWISRFSAPVHYAVLL